MFQYPLAGPFRRAFAYAIDVALLIALVIAAVIASMLLSLGSIGGGIGLALVAYFAIVWGYSAFCEAVFNGQTLGKRLVGLRVVSDRGIPITGAQAVLRSLVGTIDGPLPFCYLLGLASMLLTLKFQRLGDLAAGTMVVVEARRGRAGVIQVELKSVEALLAWLPVRVSAGPDLARALSDYVQRRGRFGPARREEMAGHLARPLRDRYGLPADSSADAVLCALYHRVFLGE